MKFAIYKHELLKMLKRVQGIVEGSNTLPILSYILIKAKKDGISASATNLEMTLLGDYEATVEKEGSVAVPAKKLFEVSREIPGEDAVFSVSDAHRVTILSGNAKFTLNGIDPKEYPDTPAIPEADMISIDSSDLVSLLRKTVYAVAASDSRVALTGLRMELAPANGNGSTSIKAVGIDGHRLAMTTKIINGAGKPFDCVVPRKALGEIIRIFDEDAKAGDVAFGITKNQAIFRRGGIVFFCKLIDGNFPNYMQVIPSNCPNMATLDRSALASALKRMSVVANGKSRAVKFDLAPGKLVLSTNNVDIGSAQEEMEITYQGEPVAIGMNGGYVLDVVNTMEADTVIMKIKDGMSPCIFTDGTDESHLCLVMPMRV